MWFSILDTPFRREKLSVEIQYILYLFPVK